MGVSVIESKSNRRTTPRYHVTKRVFVSWKLGDVQTVSLGESIGMGGVFLRTQSPAPAGSKIHVILQVMGGEVRAHALVRHSQPGRGMGVQFLQMQVGDRNRLNQFLQQYTPEKTPYDPQPGAATTESTPVAAEAPVAFAAEPLPFEREFKKKLEVASEGTHYQLLGVSADSDPKQIKQAYYSMTRKFHPDLYMANTEWLAPLQELMANITIAYKTLMDEQSRTKYDAKLAKSGAHFLRRTKTDLQKSLEESFARATQMLRIKNYVGAIGWLRKCVELSPDEAKYHALLARSLAAVPQYRTEAIREYEKAIELDSWNVTTYLEFARLYDAMKQSWRARPLYAKALEYDPTNDEAMKRLAELEPEKVGKKR